MRRGCQLVRRGHPVGRRAVRGLFEGTGLGGRGRAMSGYVRWSDIRAEHVERAGGEAAVAEGKLELLAEVLGHRLAEIPRTRGLTQEQVAEHMGVTKGRVSQIEQGKRSLARKSSSATQPLSVAGCS